MYKRILVPVDGSPASDAGLQQAISLARLSGGRVRLVHVRSEVTPARMLEGYEGGYETWLDAIRSEGRELLDQRCSVASRAGVQCDTVLLDPGPTRLAESIRQQVDQWDADLVVVGSHGRRGFDRLMMGSGAESIVRLSRVPVLIVRPEQPDVVRQEAGGGIRISQPTAALRIESSE